MKISFVLYGLIGLFFIWRGRVYLLGLIKSRKK